MADPKLKLGNDIWATKQKSLLAYNDEGGNFKSLPFQVDRISGGSYVGRNGLIQSAASNEPRIDFLNNTKGGLLLEPQRTNYLLRSDFFGSIFWSKISGGTGINPVVTDDYSISPDGTKNADRVVLNKGASDTVNDYSIIRQIVTNVGQGVSSVYMKSNTNDTYQIGIDEIGTNEVVSVTPQWQRFTYSETSNDRLQISLRGATTSDYADVSIWGAQMEAGTYASSIIPTSSAAVTRVKDEVFNGGNNVLFNDSEGVLFLDIEVPDNSSEVKQTSLNNGTTNEAAKILQLNGTTFRFEVVMSSGTNFSQDITVNPYQRNKLALQYKSNDYKVFVNGVKQSVTQRSTLPSGLNRFNFNRGFSTTDDFKGNVYQLMVFNEAISETELATLTTI